ncbi:MAG: hypothetical protein Q9202_006396 [Teloschistes flavicans]
MPGFSGSVPPPPAPPPPGGPSATSSRPPAAAAKGRGALLTDITKGTKLKKAVTNDRSAPQIDQSSSSSAGPPSGAPPIPDTSRPSGGLAPPVPGASGPHRGRSNSDTSSGGLKNICSDAPNIRSPKTSHLTQSQTPSTDPANHRIITSTYSELSRCKSAKTSSQTSSETKFKHRHNSTQSSSTIAWAFTTSATANCFSKTVWSSGASSAATSINCTYAASCSTSTSFLCPKTSLFGGPEPSFSATSTTFVRPQSSSSSNDTPASANLAFLWNRFATIVSHAGCSECIRQRPSISNRNSTANTARVISFTLEIIGPIAAPSTSIHSPTFLAAAKVAREFKSDVFTEWHRV